MAGTKPSKKNGAPPPAGKIKFAVGYQLSEPGEEAFPDIVRDYRPVVDEVYFPWSNLPSGRAALTQRRGYMDWGGQQRMESDLKALRKMGMRLDLLFNANCYGGQAVSLHLERQTCSVLEHMGALVDGVDVVTTTSLAVAHVVKKHFPDIDVRASVNMQIATANAMDYVGHLFDSYYVRREFNRDLEYLARLKDWADGADKSLHMLANSGCLHGCPGQIFHDNLVAHEREIDETVNIPDWTPHVCWNLLRVPARRVALLQASWVRPEDLRHYEKLFKVVKLATRMHEKPRVVLHAYAGRKYHGNLLNLFEPGFGPALAPAIIDNQRFPADWFERTSTCGRQCHKCDYCAKTLGVVMVTPGTGAGA